MKLSLTLPLILLLAACAPPDTLTEGEKQWPRDYQASYKCSIDQWEMVERRIDVCEAQGWGSKPFAGCPAVAILAECTWKGQEIDDNSNSNQAEPTSTPD